MAAETVDQQKHSTSTNLRASSSSIHLFERSPALVGRKLASVRQAKGCLANSPSK